MASSNIVGGERPPAIPPGHSTADLGPSDNSDSGSDLAGGAGLSRDEYLSADSGTTSDVDRAFGPGPDLGDPEMDADSDASGTGERMAAGRDTDIEVGGDIAPDRITDDPGGLLGGDDPEGVGVSSDRGEGPAKPGK